MDKQYICKSEDDIPYIVVNIEKCNIYYNRSKKRGKRVEKVKNIYNIQSGQLEPDKKTINIIDAAKYVIGMFFSVSKKYNCTRSKVEKILAIADTICYKNGYRLFNENMEIRRCGVGFSKLSSNIIANIIQDGEDKEDIISEPFLDDFEILPVFEFDNEYSSLTDYSRKLLIDVFRRFGAYQSSVLGETCDKFKDSISNGIIIEFEKANEFFNSVDFNCDNMIANYIREYH